MNLRKPIKVTGVVTQGRAKSDREQFVTSYKIAYSHDGNIFTTVKNTDGTDKVRRTSWIKYINQFFLGKIIGTRYEPVGT